MCYFSLCYVFWGHIDSVGRGTTVQQKIVNLDLNKLLDYDTDVNLVFKYYLSRQVNTAVVINESCKISIVFFY